MTTQTISCPISAERVDEGKVRSTAALVVFISILALSINSAILFLLLGIDFALRSFIAPRLSPLGELGLIISKALKLPVKPTDAAPKKFAAALGLVFALSTAILLYINSPLGIATGIILAFCALLEAAAGVCLGCYVYSVLVKLVRWKV